MSELRLSGGLYRGRKLRVPGGVRPTEGRVREALFSIWQGELPGARFLDLFAGAGAVGIEAVGRGVEMSVLVEGDARTLRTLGENLQSLAVGESARTYRLRLPAGLTVLAAREAPFRLVFADPPYGFTDGAALLAGLVPLLAPGGAVAVEHAARDGVPPAPPSLELVETRCYGGSCLSFYRGRD